jgi:hypothetical protein
MATEIFICYRRGDSAGYTRAIEDRIKRDLGDVLFVDVDAVPLGVNFVKFLREEVARCAVLLAVIGDRWLDARDEDGTRRLDNPNDFVRVEIGAALRRNIPVIPILLDGVKIPRANQLPNDLEELAVRNALDVRHASFHNDMNKLVRELKRQLEVREDRRNRVEAEAQRQAGEDGQVEAQRQADEGRGRWTAGETRSGAQIYISYRRMDNLPPPDNPNSLGFVDYLLRQLRYELQQLGANAIVWKDRLLIEPGDVWSEAVLNAILKEADLFIVILSNNYIKSNWLERELAAIASKQSKRSKQYIIFRVDKQNVPENQVPEVLQRIMAVRFYREDVAGHVDEFFWRGKERFPEDYGEAVHHLAMAIYKRLETLGILYRHADDRQSQRSVERRKNETDE